MHKSAMVVASLLVPAAAAHAGETPLYQPAPAWITKADLKQAGSPTESPDLLIVDQQQRIEDGRLWVYSDTATRVSSTEALSQFATLALPWMPDKGDLIIHDLAIIRDGQEINLLKDGKGFTVLRREQGLEQRELTGMLSATMPVEGLQIGDVLRLRHSVTLKDDALAGRVQNVMPLIPAPIRVGFGRMKMQWDAKSAAHWKILATGVDAKPVQKNGYTELQINLPVAKQPEMPGDAPSRFQRPPLMEISTFANWAEVSKVMAPLYRTDGLIADGSKLAVELATVKAGATPLERAQRALRLVQDNVRYLAIGMNGGNYVPQKPEATWALRYGDCKAKTLLLLALLHGAGIDAEAVLVNSRLGDLVPERLPSAAAFDHVIVRATIGGQSLWLDGTANGGRIEDIRDTPPFRNILPLRTDGAELMALTMRKDARPTIDFAIEADESASVDLPSAFKAKAVVRGPGAAALRLASSQVDRKQRDIGIRQFFTGFVGESQFGDVSLSSDEKAGTVTLTAEGVAGTSWSWQDKRMKRWLIRSLGSIGFDPDRARTNWSTVPVATPYPGAIHFSLQLRLPRAGQGFTFEGEPKAVEHVAGREINRTVSLANGVVTVDERLDNSGAEIAVADIPVERDRLAAAQARLPKLIAPTDTPRRWDLKGQDPKGATQLAAIDAIYTKALASSEPEDTSVYTSRASLRQGIGDWTGALADLGKAIERAPDADLYIQRASLLRDLGRLAEAQVEAEKARTLDPSSEDANSVLAGILAESGNLQRATSLLDERIALGGEARASYRRIKADVIGEYGDPQEALKIIDALIEDKPGSPALLNARCWIMGSRSVMVDAALKDCTSAVELSSTSFNALDSRALVWFRLGRYDDALRDLNAILAAAPGMAPSRYMRGIVLGRMDRGQEAAADLAIARLLEPRIDATYARYGIKP